MAEKAAKERGCSGIDLDTMSFQAPGFYEKLGFTKVGEIAQLQTGNQKILLLKRTLNRCSWRSYFRLNLIPNFLIRCLSVFGLMPSKSAAPPFPLTLRPTLFRTASMCPASTSSSR